tara:strand:+ start:1660 stop:2574 length:915 start_codon:yes stop_codon:yes gene_type:complete
MTTFVFPGQGSQFVGMSKDFYENFTIAKTTFEEIEDYTKINLKEIIFEDNKNKLNLTNYTQIAIFTASLSIFKTYQNEKDLKLDSINTMLGHSLGEYSALACSEKLSLKDCSIILKQRGELMNSAIKPNETGMAALIGLSASEVQNIIDKNNLNIQIANDNSQMQIVVSGNHINLDQSMPIFLDNKIKKFIKLNVSAAFHSNFMLEAQKDLSIEIDKLNFIQNNVNIVSNFNAKISNENLDIKESLKNQMSNKVRWTESIINLEKYGENSIIEIGPGKILSGLIKRISPNFAIKTVNSISDLDN